MIMDFVVNVQRLQRQGREENMKSQITTRAGFAQRGGEGRWRKRKRWEEKEDVGGDGKRWKEEEGCRDNDG